MTAKKSSQPSGKLKLLDPQLFLLLGGAAFAYYIIWAIVAALLGKGFATWIATPLWGVPVFIIARWDRMRTQQDINWRDYIKLPKLKFWKIGLTFLTIFIIQFVMGFIFARYQDVMRPDYVDSLPDAPLKMFDALTDDWQFIVASLIALLVSYFIGGYLAGKLSPYEYMAPYSHAAIGGFLYSLLNFVVIIPLLMWNDLLDPPTEEDVGKIILAISPSILFSVLGARVAIRKPIFRRSKRMAEDISANPESTPNVDSPAPVAVTHQLANPDKLVRGKAKVVSQKRKKRGRRR